MNLEERMKMRQDDFLAAFERDPDNSIRDLLIMYRGRGSDAADFFFEKFSPAAFDPEGMEAEKKSILEKMRDCIIKLPGVVDEQQRELDQMEAAAIEEAFNARLAERVGEAGG